MSVGGRDLLGVLPVLAFVAAFTLIPVSALFVSGFLGLGGPGEVARVLTDPVNVRALENSLTEGGAGAAVAVAVGYPVGVFLGRTRIPGRPVLLAALLVPFLLPTIAVALGVDEAFGPGSGLAALAPSLAVFGSGFGGVVMANVAFNAPVVVLLTIVGIESASTVLEETVASLGGGPAEAYRRVWAGPSLLGALCGGLVAFLFSALAFAGPILIGGAPWYTLEARVYVLAQTLGEIPQAAVLAATAVLLLTPATVLYVAMVTRLRAGPAHPRSRPRPFDRTSPVAWVLGGWTVLMGAAVVGFLSLIVVRGFAPSAPGRSWGSGLTDLFSTRVTDLLGIPTSDAVVNTAVFATLAGLVALVLAVTATFSMARRPGAHRVVGAFAFAPLLVSPVVLSLGLAEFVRPVLGGESAVPLLIIVSQATLALPFALQAIGLSIGSIDPGLAESARGLGASPWQAYLDVELPIARAGIRAAGLFAFALGLGEFTATNFLATPSSTTLSVELYHLESVRLGGLAPAVAALLVITSLAVFLVVALWGEGRADVF